MGKTEVYSWRLDPETKGKLAETARAERTSLAQLLDRIVTNWLRRQAASGSDDERQQRLHAAARNYFGTMEGGDADLAAQAKQRVRAKIRSARFEAVSTSRV